jgi:hypothetical protein
VRSFSILRTNTGLTTNIKVVVDSKYKLYLDSINSTQELAYSKYKRKSFNKRNYYDELIPYFFKDTPSEIAYYIDNIDADDVMSDKFSEQYSELYRMGARNILENKSYSEEYEYFAPLYIVKNKIPKGFIIFRVDGQGLIDLNSGNFKGEIINKLKTVKFFDMSEETPLGEWMNINFINNDSFPDTPFELDFRSLEFSRWNGIDYETGGYTSKSLFLEDILSDENEIFELERFITTGYKNNKVVFPNIINLTFLYDDEPATATALRKWSINRYFGFYIDDMEKVISITPYYLPLLKQDYKVDSGNILTTIQGDVPFVGGWVDDKIYHVEYNGNFYKVEKFEERLPNKLQPVRLGNKTKIFKKNTLINDEVSEVIITKYRIISDIDLHSKYLNTNLAFIDNDNILRRYDLDLYNINDFDKADVWVIEIDGKFHNIIKGENGELKLVTDYSFEFKDNSYDYWINQEDPNFRNSISLVVDENTTPKSFSIFKLKFSDVKDFDTKVIDTEFSKYEYEKKSEITETDETKMYMSDLNSNSNPKELTDYIYKDNIVNIPVSSEYTANYETFKISNGELSDIWKMNPVYSRWGFQNSISTNDYPYLLNNSQLFEDYNRTTNPFDPDPKRIERNLDYFYSLNSSTSSYLHHSLHVEDHLDNGELNINFKFELDKYLNLNNYEYDYFYHLFERRTSFLNGEILKNTKKYSVFNTGDGSVPNLTLFRGIKFFLYDVASIIKDDNGLKYNLLTSNKFEDYKFSILLSKNAHYIEDNLELIESKSGDMNWTIVSEWEMDKIYEKGSVVVCDDIIYVAKNDNITEKPENENLVKTFPANLESWSLAKTSIMWNYNHVYAENNIVYNGGEFYRRANGDIIDFWNPTNTYDIGDVILFNNEYYKSTISQNKMRPDSSYTHKTIKGNIKYWEKIINKIELDSLSGIKWELVKLWNPSFEYNMSEYVVHQKAVYMAKELTIDVNKEPGKYNEWELKYNILADTDMEYKSNDLIELNNKYYIYDFKLVSSTTDTNKTTNIWYFGNKAGLDFNTEPPTPLIGYMSTFEGCITISDVNGNLLFYSDGRTVWDKNHNIMPNGEFLRGHSSSTQSGVIIPYPNNPNKYILFTVYYEYREHNVNGNTVNGGDFSGVHYSVIDMTLNNGLGDVDINNKNIRLKAPTAEKLSAVKHANGVDYWISYIDENGYYVHLVTNSGVEMNSHFFQRNDWWTTSSNRMERSVGFMKFSPNGAKLIANFFSESNGFVDIIDFNNLTGVLSNRQVIYSDVQPATAVNGSVVNGTVGSSPYGLEFSPNSKFAYISNMRNGRNIMRFDVEDPVTTKEFLTSVQNSNIYYGPAALQLAPNGNIYVAISNVGYLGVIENPDSLNISDVTFTLQGQTLYPGTLSRLGLPNSATSFIVDDIISTPYETLRNGINIYINKRWKNVLVNIAIDDNTLPNLSNSDRDIIYTDLYKKITAHNFINCINDLSNKYGFVDYVNYIIIDENNNITKYNYNNIEGLPYLLTCETPEEIKTRINSIVKKPIRLGNLIKPTKKLNNGKIDDIETINYYDNIPFAAEVIKNPLDPKVLTNFSGGKNIIYDVIYRFSGYYMPIFYDIELFDKSVDIYGNYKFDTHLTNFGKALEQKIRKINRGGDILKLKNTPSVKSIYPMIDEFGYTTHDVFIFKSTWDLKYYIETSDREIIIEETINIPEESNLGEDESNID